VNGTVTYAFRAVRPDGRLEVGVIEASTREAAIALIGSRGSYPIEVLRSSKLSTTSTHATSADVALGLRALATLLEAGLPISRALAVLEGLVPACWTAALPLIRTRIEQGDSLAAALRTSSLPLPPHVLGVIEAGEAGGGVAPAVVTAAQLVEGRAATSAALWNALAYPLMLAVTGTASIALLVGIVLPRFAGLMADSGQALPLMTRLMLGLNGVVHAAVVPGLLCTAAALVAWRAWTTRPEGRTKWHTLLLDAPALGPIRCSAATASACATLAALLHSGVQLAAAIPFAARAAGDAAIEAALLRARTRIVAGESFAGALQAENALTVTAIRFACIGEETGGLSPMLQHAAQIESGNALLRLKRLIRLLEPALILAFGAIVMAVAAALLQAVYGVRPSI
jgi:general secretion pathway protein F